MGAWRGVRGVVVSQFFLFTWIPGSLVSRLAYEEMDMDVSSQNKSHRGKKKKGHMLVLLLC